MKVMTSEERIRRAAAFLLLGLGVEALSLYWSHPLSLPLFLVIGALLAALGAGSFLLALVSPPAAPRVDEVEELDEESRREAVG
jgi:hypothetical protein